MDIDPPKRWQTLRLKVLWRLPKEPRKKIKAFLRLGDAYQQQGEEQLATYCYDLSKSLAQETGAIHLLKKINQRVQ